MPSARPTSVRLFRIAGVDVFVPHWSWILVAAFEVGPATTRYSSVPKLQSRIRARYERTDGDAGGAREIGQSVDELAGCLSPR